jgi:hypothetical protein
MKQRVIVIGAGISGLTSAWLLKDRFDVTVVDDGDHIGGHTHTHAIKAAGQEWKVDSGFIVFNHHNYPRFTKLLEQLRVTSQATEMTFSVVNQRSGLEYAATNLNTLFSQRRNLLRKHHWRMIGDIFRFYRSAPKWLADGEDRAIGDLLVAKGFGRGFIEDHFLPMCAALWSAPQKQVAGYSAQAILRFMDNHRMLQVSGRPTWRTVTGGSNSYVKALLANSEGQITWHRAAASEVERGAEHVTVCAGDSELTAEQVIFACHSDQALALLGDASEPEQAVLGDIPYQPNHVVLHSDTSVLPKAKRCWSAWNACVPADHHAGCSVSYYMNALQRLPAQAPDFCVTLNPPEGSIDDAKVFARMNYAHPVFTPGAIKAQQRWEDINGVNRTWFAGAYWGYGFHEDGVNSAWRVVNALAPDAAATLD